MKIAYLTNRFPPAFGGAERFINSLLKEFVKKNDFTATVLTSDFLNSTGSQRVSITEQSYFPSSKVTLHRLHAFRFFNRDALTFIPGLFRQLRKVNDYDIVHVFTYGYMTSWLPAIMKSMGLLKPKLVFSPLYAPNTVYPKILTKIYDQTLGRVSITKADKILLLSSAFKDFFESKTKSIAIIPHPIDPIPSVSKTEKRETKQKFRIPLDKKIILSISRLVKSKGVHLLIDGVKAYINSGKDDIFLVIAGNGAEAINLKEQIARLHLENHVILLQNISDYDRNLLYNIADIFALMSYSGEAFGITQIEAMSLGVPVLGNSNGVAKFIIKPGITGELIDPFIPQEIKDGIITILESRDNYFQSPNTPQNIVKTYDPHAVSEMFYKVYEQLAAKE